MARYFRSSKKRKGKYKSGLENDFATAAFKQGLAFEYEADTFPYVRPSHYSPDWKIGTDVYIETKGYFSRAHRHNLLAFREQYPQVHILLLFGNAQNKLSAKSKTTYAQWCDKNGFEWADFRNGIPQKWWDKYNNNANQKNSQGRRRKRRSDPDAVPGTSSVPH